MANAETTAEWNLLRRRERLARQLQLVCRTGLMRGSLVTLARRCGKARCVCVTEGRKHEGLYVSVSLYGRTRLAHVRAERTAEVRAGLAAYAKLWSLLDELTEVNLRLLGGGRKRAPKRSTAGAR